MSKGCWKTPSLITMLRCICAQGECTIDLRSVCFKYMSDRFIVIRRIYQRPALTPLIFSGNQYRSLPAFITNPFQLFIELDDYVRVA